MHWLRQQIRNYFGFSKTETNGFMLMFPLLLLILFLPSLYTSVFSEEYDPNGGDQQMLDSIMAAWLVNEKELPIEEPKKAFDLFAFDPNTATNEQLQNLGIPAFLAGRIERYRDKGGKFRVKSDLSRIYDFPDSLYTVLSSFIQLPEKVIPVASKPKMVKASLAVHVEDEHKEPEPEEVPLLIDINTADTTVLKQLRGIGSGYSRRIIKYRELLGGYSHKDQISEVYGISDSLFQSLSDHLYVGEYEIDRLNVNLANFKTLNKHPYISYKQAGAILNTRSKKGKFRSPLDLLVVEGMDTVKIQRLTPYISF